MNIRILTISTLLSLAGTAAIAQTSELSSIDISTAVTAGGTANGVAVITQRIGTALNQPGSIGSNLAGIQYVAGQVPLDGAPPSIAFFSLSGAAIPGGVANPAADFTSYGTLTSPTGVVTYPDVASKLTPNSYSGLTFASADLGFGAGNFYAIHHAANNVDYFAEIVPGTGTSSSIADLKPMSWQGPTAGTPASPGANGYFALTWATGILSAGAPYADQSMYYLRTDSSSHTQFGVMIPGLTGASSDTLDLTTAVGSFGVSGYTTLAFVPTTVIGNYPTNNFYYLRLDSLTGNTVLGRLNPSLVAGARTISDIANLGGVFDSLTFAFDATGPAGAWGTTQFYATGTLAAGAQSVSFEAIPDHNVGDVFTVTPTASSGLDIDVTVVSGPATVATTGSSGANPSLRVFTITTTGPGIVTLQARQAGQVASPAFTANMLRQSFNVLGLPVINSANTAAGSVGTAFSYAITATGSPLSYTASPLPAGLSVVAATGAITGTPTTSGVTVVTLTATNATGTSLPATLTITVAAAGVAPVISGPTVAAGTVGAAFSYNITATGSPTSYSASPLPAGLSVVAATGAISGTPSSSGVTVVTLTATNGTGTSLPVTLTITVAAATIAPVITSPITAPGTVGTAFVTYTILATGSPTSYSATGLPAGLTLNLLTGAINGTPTASGVSVVAISATNGAGTGSATLTITIAAATSAPIVTSPTVAAGTVGTTFVTYLIGATGLPTVYSASGLPAGLTLNTLTGAISGTPTLAGTSVVTLTATNSTGSGTATLTITIAASTSAPVISSPTTTAGSVGSPFPTYTIVATGQPTTYTATGLPPGLTIDPLTGTIDGTPTLAGTYVVTVSATNSFGTTTSSLTISIATSGFSHIVNFSARAISGVGSDTLIVGFGVSGDGKNLLVRGIGPALAEFGITNFLAAPTLTLYDSTGAVEESDSGWEVDSSGVNDGAEIAATAASVGAFALPANSLDSALLVTVDSGIHTTGLLTSNGAPGVGLIEIYDVGGNPYASLTNVSARMEVTSGDGVLIAGFVIAGDAPKTVLIRGIGPTLSAFGVTGVLADPQIAVFSGGVQIASNAGWGTGTDSASQLSTVFAEVGAFALPSGSKDSALVLTLQPGTYTVVVSSVSNSTGVALVEVYDTQ
jgi:PKD repeat protein